MLKDPDRFRHVDPAVFLDPAVTSPEYRARYGVSSSSADTDLEGSRSSACASLTAGSATHWAC